MEREDLIVRIEHLETKAYGLDQICWQLANLPDGVDFIWPEPQDGDGEL